MLRPPSSVLGTAPWRRAPLPPRSPAVLPAAHAFADQAPRLADGELTERTP